MRRDLLLLGEMIEAATRAVSLTEDMDLWTARGVVPIASGTVPNGAYANAGIGSYDRRGAPEISRTAAHTEAPPASSANRNSQSPSNTV